MRCFFIFIVCVTVACTVRAQRLSNASKTGDLFRLNFVFTPVLPVGQFSFRNSDTYLTGQTRVGAGGSFGVQVPFYRGWVGGTNVSFVFYQFDKAGISRQAYNSYKDNMHFVTVKSGMRGMLAQTYSFTIAKTLDVGSFEIEPNARMGIMSVEVYDKMMLRRKRMNSNFYEDITISAGDARSGFAYSIGISALKPLASWVVLYTGVNFSGSNVQVDMKESKSDFYDNTSEAYFSVAQPVSAFQADIGFQFRINKAPDPKTPDNRGRKQRRY